MTAPQSSTRTRVAFVMLWTMVAAGGLASLWSLVVTLQRPELWPALTPFLAGAVVAEFMCVHVYQARQQRLSFSFSMVASMAAVAAQPMTAPLVNVTAALVAITIVTRVRGWNKMLFNVANPVIASVAAAWVYELLRPVGTVISVWNLGASLAAVLVYVAANVGLVSLMISLHSGRRLRSVLRDSGWFAPINVLLGLTGAFVGGAYTQLGPIVVGMFITPVLLMRYTLAFYARRSQATISTLENQAATLERQTNRLEHLAMHDGLTDLPNRVFLECRLEALLADSSAGSTTLLLLDLDRFKEVNDTFGHRHGDLLLQQIGPRLAAVLSQPDTIARLGGDEFAVVLPNMTGQTAERVARELLSAFKEPFMIEGYPVEVSASIGISATSDAGGDAASMLRHGDVAMYVAKRGQLGVALYRPQYDQYSPERLTLVGELRHAIESDSLTVFYQPQIDCRTGRMVSAEALLRWQHPIRGNIPPDQFVALAERTGLIRPLTRWVLEHVLRQCRAWLDAGYAFPVAVNASMYDLHDAGLPEVISGLLSTWRVPAEFLRIELTEGTLMADATRTLDVLERLRAIGIEISVDDFGTGYSSLAYLSRLPVNELKIDRSFVSAIRDGERNAAIVRSTIRMGHELGLTVVAEGVEDEESYELLRQFGCDTIQGYWISRPVSAPAFAEWLASSPRSAGVMELRAA